MFQPKRAGTQLETAASVLGEPPRWCSFWFPFTTPKKGGSNTKERHTRSANWWFGARLAGKKGRTPENSLQEPGNGEPQKTLKNWFKSKPPKGLPQTSLNEKATSAPKTRISPPPRWGPVPARYDLGGWRLTIGCVGFPFFGWCPFLAAQGNHKENHHLLGGGGVPKKETPRPPPPQLQGTQRTPTILGDACCYVKAFRPRVS